MSLILALHVQRTLPSTTLSRVIDSKFGTLDLFEAHHHKEAFTSRSKLMSLGKEIMGLLMHSRQQTQNISRLDRYILGAVK